MMPGHGSRRMQFDPTPFLQYGMSGFALLLLLGIGYGLRFLAIEILKPIRDAMVADIGGIKSTLVQIHSNTEHVKDTLENHGDRLDSIDRHLGARP